MITAIVLAAGQSRRLGQPKLLLPVAGRSLIRTVLDNVLASRVDDLVVVVGAYADVIRPEIAAAAANCPSRLRVVENAEYHRGQSTSLRAGLQGLDTRCTAALIVLGDQPFVTAEVIDALIERFASGDAPLVYPTYDGQRGTPVLFARALFPELLAVSGDQGGRDIVAKHLAQAAAVSLPRPEAALDIDTWQDYRRLCHPSTDAQPTDRPRS